MQVSSIIFTIALSDIDLNISEENELRNVNNCFKMCNITKRFVIHLINE